MLETGAEDFDYVISINLRAAYFVAKSVAAGMVEAGRPGAIIHISSQMGHVPRRRPHRLQREQTRNRRVDQVDGD